MNSKFVMPALFLLAGTALSQAATLVAQWDDFDSLTSDQGSHSLTVSTGTDGASLNTDDNTLRVNGVDSAENRASVDLTGAEITSATGWSLVLTLSDISSSNTAVWAAMGYDSSAAAANGSNSYSFGQNGHGVMTTLREGSATNATNNLPTNASNVVDGRIFVLTYDNGVITLYYDGQQISTINAANTSAATATAFTTLALGGATDYPGTASSFTVSQMAIYSGALSAEDIAVGNVYAAALPEPSAFGLLAGLGALALVAARRRRGRKS